MLASTWLIKLRLMKKASLDRCTGMHLRFFQHLEKKIGTVEASQVPTVSVCMCVCVHVYVCTYACMLNAKPDILDKNLPKQRQSHRYPGNIWEAH